MHKFLWLFGATMIAAVSHATLLSNGDFEINSFCPGDFSGDPADDWSILGSLYATPDVWDNLGSQGLAPGYGGFMGHATAYQGTKWAGFGAQTNFQEGIASKSVFLAAGTYKLSLAMFHDSGDTSRVGTIDVSVSQGGGSYVFQGLLAANTVDDQWQQRSMQFTLASSGTTSIGLTASFLTSGTASDFSYMGIDEVGLNAVPEPTTLVTAGIFAAIGLRKKLRKDQP